MRKVIWLAAVLLSGCATGPSLNCDETCALEGMICKGQSMGSASGSSSMSDNPLVSLKSSSNSKNYFCEKDSSKADEVASFARDAKAKINPAENRKKLTVKERSEQYRKTGLYSDYAL